MRSEAGIAAIRARADSPGWLEEEVARTRTALLHLRQNVVLLRNPDEPDSFYPVCSGGRPRPLPPTPLPLHAALKRWQAGWRLSAVRSADQ